MPEVAVGGVRLHVELAGPAGGEPVVFVNGLLTDCTSWAAHLPFFTDRYRTITYDCRGQGRSDKPDEVYETARHAADLAALVDALAIEHARFVGLSNGGAALLDFAASHPERVRALAVSGAYARVDAILRAKLGSWVAAMDAGGPLLRFDVATPWVWGGAWLAEREDALRTYREKGAAIPAASARNLIRGAMVHDVRDRLRDVTAPALVVVGEEDVLTPPWLARELVAALPRAELLVVAGAGHAAALELVETFSRAVRTFFDAH